MAKNPAKKLREKNCVSGHRRSRCCRGSCRPSRPPRGASRSPAAPGASGPAAGRASDASPGSWDGCGMASIDIQVYVYTYIYIHMYIYIYICMYVSNRYIYIYICLSVKSMVYDLWSSHNRNLNPCPSMVGWSHPLRKGKPNHVT